MENITAIIISFFIGSLPLSLWLGRLVIHEDIRMFGDHNPGAANVWQTAGKGWGLLAVLLDFLKGAIPVGTAKFLLEPQGASLVLIALAPVLGSTLSPFLGFQGGKSLSVSFGIWSGLTIWVVPMVLGISLAVWLKILKVPGWAILAGMLTLLVFLIISNAGNTLLSVWVGNLILLIWKHKDDYHKPPQFWQIF